METGATSLRSSQERTFGPTILLIVIKYHCIQDSSRLEADVMRHHRSVEVEVLLENVKLRVAQGLSSLTTSLSCGKGLVTHQLVERLPGSLVEILNLHLSNWVVTSLL